MADANQTTKPRRSVVHHMQGVSESHWLSVVVSGAVDDIMLDGVQEWIDQQRRRLAKVEPSA